MMAWVSTLLVGCSLLQKIRLRVRQHAFVNLISNRLSYCVTTQAAQSPASPHLLESEHLSQYLCPAVQAPSRAAWDGYPDQDRPTPTLQHRQLSSRRKLRGSATPSTCFCQLEQSVRQLRRTCQLSKLRSGSGIWSQSEEGRQPTILDRLATSGRRNIYGHVAHRSVDGVNSGACDWHPRCIEHPELGGGRLVKKESAQTWQMMMPGSLEGLSWQSDLDINTESLADCRAWRRILRSRMIEILHLPWFCGVVHISNKRCLYEPVGNHPRILQFDQHIW